MVEEIEEFENSLKGKLKGDSVYVSFMGVEDGEDFAVREFAEGDQESVLTTMYLALSSQKNSKMKSYLIDALIMLLDEENLKKFNERHKKLHNNKEWKESLESLLSHAIPEKK